MSKTVADHIEITPGVCGGRPRIRGHRIRVQDVVVWHEALGLSPEEITARYPQLGLADVYAALTYYHDHREAIRSDMETEEALLATTKPKSPSKLH